MVSMGQSNLENARILLEHGTDINAKDKHGRTPLQVSLEREYDEVSYAVSFRIFKARITSR
jgi:ankyrin repeat protein